MLMLEPEFIESKQTFCETSLKIIQVLCKAGAICTKEVLEDYLSRALLHKFPNKSGPKFELLPDDKLHFQKGIAPLVDSMIGEINGFGQTEGHMSRPQLSDEAYGRVIREAAGLGEVEVLQKYFEKSRSLDLRDDRMRTALHIAAFRGRLDAAEFLIRHQADPKTCDIDGNTPLHLACIGNREETIHHLWSYSEMKNSNGESPLMLAAAHCLPSTFQSLLARASQEAICERAPNGYSILHFAAAAGKALNVVHLIDKGLDVNDVSNDKWTPIMAAIKGDDNSDISKLESSLELVLKTLIDHGGDLTLNLQDKKGDTCLHILCQYVSGDSGERAAKMLLEHGASWELRNVEQNTAIDEALETDCENAGIVNLLMSKHLDLNQQDKLGETILHRIFGVRRPSSFEIIARSAIERKGDLSIKNLEGMTVLVSAFDCNQRTNILEILLSSVLDDDLSKHSFEGFELLDLSMRYSLDTDLVSTILDRSRVVNSSDNRSRSCNTLHTACECEPSPRIMRRILSLCDDLSIPDNLGSTPLFIAAYVGNIWMISELIAAKVNLETRGSLRPSSRTTAKTLTPLLATACGKGNRIHLKSATLLIEAGADLEARDSTGRGLIAYCSKKGDEEALRYLSTTKINFACIFPKVLSGNEVDYTALHHAAELGHLECIRIILKTGAFPNVDVAGKYGITPLLLAVNFDMLDICKVLCDNGAKVNVIDTRTGNSPLHISAIKGLKPIMLFLLQQGADVTLQNNAGFTAEYEALSRGHYEVAEILNTKASDMRRASDTSSNSPGKARPQPLSFIGHHDCMPTPKSLNHSIKVGAIKFWRQFLAERLDLNIPACTHGSEDGSFCSPLNVTLDKRKESLVKLFLEHGADVHHEACTVKKSLTPLETCAIWGNLRVMRLILNKYELPLNKNSLGGLAKGICAAASQGNISCLEELCKYGTGEDFKANVQRFAPQAGPFRTTALCEAARARSNQKQSVKLLLKHGAKLNDVDEGGCSPLHNAASSGNCSLIQILVYNGAYIHARSKSMNTPILTAAENSHLEAIKLLYKLGSSLEDRDLTGNGLLDLSLNTEPATGMPILSWLTANMPWKLYYHPIWKGSLLGRAIHQSDGNFTAVCYLIDNGADLLQKARFHGSVLHVAAHYGYTWLTERLLPLIPKEEIAEILDYSSKIYGTALYAASGQGHERIAEVLLDAGASINAWSTVHSNVSGTPLMIAYINGHEGVVRLLLSRGARMTVVNGDGLEGGALRVARARCVRTLQILQEWEAATTDRCSYFAY